MKQELKGCGVALVTPFSESGAIDYAGLERLVLHMHRGADYLVVAGTTGEAATLTDEEQAAVLDFVIEINAGKLPVVLGLGGNNTKALAERAASVSRKDVAALLSVSPYYNRPGQEGIYLHYKALAEASPLPVIAYNVPSRTGAGIAPETTVRMARDLDNVIGIKEASGSIVQVMQLAERLPDDFLLISGDDALALPHMACGGHGIISVVANAYPKKFGDVIRLTAEGRFSEARTLHYQLLPLIELLFSEGNPAGIKEVLRHIGICGNAHRLPLVSASKALSDKLYAQVAEIGSEQ